MRVRRLLPSVCVSIALVLLTSVTAFASHSERDSRGRPLHWSRSGTALAQVYFVDHTGARWPVGRSVWKWNTSSRVKSYYESRCPSSSLHCVNVNEYNRADRNYGFAELRWDGSAHFTYAAVYLNDRYRPGAADDRQTVCQETGHVLGLDHQHSSTSCMNDTTHNVQYPNSHDYGQLAAVYNH
jgi:hypothetical protein